IINDTTDNSGILQIIDIPPATAAYNIYISKSGYSSDRTYAPTPQNPNPDKPPATVAAQQLTQISFVIDELSKLSFSSVTPSCEIVPNFDFSLKGDRLIGQELSRYYVNVSTNSSGILNMDPIEWDSYTVTPNDGAYDLAGINPLNPISLNPGSTQSVQLIAIPQNTNSLLFTIKDSSTDLPLSGVLVKLYRSGSLIGSKTTGQGHLDQADWSGGGGQVGFVDSTKYWSTDGNIDTSSGGNILLRKIFENYSSNGMLESSTFNTGTSSNFYNISWSPGIQPLVTGQDSARLQFATSPSSTPAIWNFFGPDGTATTYYVSPESPINNIHSGDQYARYRVYLSTITATSTPNISNISFTYTSDCIPPGQVIFSGLSSGTYTIEVSKSGYSTYSREIYLESSWQEEQVLLGP
ncbi:MAG: carboxypeptidase-like regulatory domain-containing protein, partial [Candidatus Paceibacterota bacterium]